MSTKSEHGSAEAAASTALSAPECPPPLPRLSPRPVQVDGVTEIRLDLGGTWRFHPAPAQDFAASENGSESGWTDIHVPGEWVMQGFAVAPNTRAGYRRTFALPRDWEGKRIKLRCDGVYSDAIIWINGREVGRHVGGFTPFELDVTAFVDPAGVNAIAVGVISESLADLLACASQYACHPLGGISRKITLFALPEVHCSALRVATRFDKEFKHAELSLDLNVTLEGAATDAEVDVQFSLWDPAGRPVPLDPASLRLAATAGATTPARAVIPIAAPRQWSNEHPELYRLEARVVARGQVQEVLCQAIGFRQVEVRGNRLFINNVPVKLRGACRHEVHPLRGRSLTAEFWRKDVEIFRDGNCNYLRTSHYPPAEEFLQACDELGMFVEVEGPYCWAERTQLDEAQIADLMVRQELEMLEACRNHPCVIQWSMGNESSKWDSYFLPAAKLFKKLDPTRPLVFSQFSPDADGGFCEIGNHHYPGFWGPDAYLASTRPITFDEYCHLNSYNRRELVSDPGLRDLWGQGLDRMWNQMRRSEGVLGGAIWAAIDDTFFLPSGETVGYGTWGPVDGWRRPKPEFWHMKKAYSPLRLSETCVACPVDGQPVCLSVENRHEFTDLSDLRFEWAVAGQAGTVTTAGALGAVGLLAIPVSAAGTLVGQLLDVRAISSRGYAVDRWQVALGVDPRVAPPCPAPAGSGACDVKEVAGGFAVSAGAWTLKIDTASATITATTGTGNTVLLARPELLLLPCNGDQCGGTQMTGMEPDVAPFTATCRDWQVASVTARSVPGGAEIRIAGQYAEAHGTFHVVIGNSGTMTVRYAFTIRESINAEKKCDPRQIGLVFTLPAECQTIAWRRQSSWSYYPADHIGRPIGETTAFVAGVPLSGLAGPRAQPAWSWSQDGNRYGTNDFRSTKMNIVEASLRAADGLGVRVLSDGRQHVRAWVDGAVVRLLVADHSNEGAPPFFCEHVVPRQPLKPGLMVDGCIRLELQG